MSPSEQRQSLIAAGIGNRRGKPASPLEFRGFSALERICSSKMSNLQRPDSMSHMRHKMGTTTEAMGTLSATAQPTVPELVRLEAVTPSVSNCLNHPRRWCPRHVPTQAPPECVRCLTAHSECERSPGNQGIGFAGPRIGLRTSTVGHSGESKT